MGSALNSQPPPLPPGQEPLPQPPREIVLQPNGKQAAPPPPPERGFVDIVRDPGFGSAMNRQDYENFMRDQRARLDAERASGGNQDFIDARQPGFSYMTDMVNYIDPVTGEKASRTRGIVPGPGSRFVPVPAERFQAPNQPIATTGSAMPQAGSNITQMEPIQSQDEINKRMEFIRTLNENPRFQEFQRTPPPQIPISQLPQANVPAVNQPAQPIPQMQQMQNYNQMLQQGMRRNQDMNQAAQNLAAPAGPVRSFSQMAGGTRRARRTPRQPRNNFLSPSNQKLI